MKKRPTLAKKTKEKLKWLDENYHKFEFKDDLYKAMAKKFGICIQQAPRVEKVFLGKIENMSKIDIKYKNKNGFKKEYGKKDLCYFCKSNKFLIAHHISYLPEIIIYLCKSCHRRIHFVLKEYHQSQIMLNEKMKKISLGINSLNEVLNQNIIPISFRKKINKKNNV